MAMPRMRVLEFVHEEEQNGRIVMVRTAYEPEQEVTVYWNRRWRPGVVVSVGQTYLRVNFQCNRHGNWRIERFSGDRVWPVSEADARALDAMEADAK